MKLLTVMLLHLEDMKEYYLMEEGFSKFYSKFMVVNKGMRYIFHFL